MIKSTAIFAAAIAAAMTFSQPSAEAGKVGVTIGFGSGHWHNGYNHYDPFYEPAYSYQDALPRWRVLRKLERRGYYNFRRLRLRGDVYKVKARKNGRRYSLRIDAYSGRVISRHRI